MALFHLNERLGGPWLCPVAGRALTSAGRGSADRSPALKGVAPFESLLSKKKKTRITIFGGAAFNKQLLLMIMGAGLTMTAMRVSCWRSCPGCLRFGEVGGRAKLRSLFQLRSALFCFSSPLGKQGQGFFLQWSPESGWREEKKFIMQRGMIYSFKICQPEFGAASSLCQMRNREALTFRDAPCVM